jgi:hypothetical protein
MAHPANESATQAQVDTRANLFYFLQSLPVPADDKGHRQGAESLTSDDQSQSHQQQASPSV